MKNLDLNAYGVEEMDNQEMLDNNGGSLLAIGIGLLVVALCAASCTVIVTTGDDNTVTGTTSVDSTGNGNSVEPK